jgi:hypothetical protein
MSSGWPMNGQERTIGVSRVISVIRVIGWLSGGTMVGMITIE